MTRSRRTIAEPAGTPPITFEIGQHRVVITIVHEGRWNAAVDDHALEASFATEADAWAAGVREAQRLDLPRG